MTWSDVQSLEIQIPREITQNWGWFLAFGIILLALGIVAVMHSATATLVSMMLLGWLLIIASSVEIIQVVMVGRWAGLFYHLVAAILFGVAGIFMVMRPAVSAEVVTAFMGMFFLVSGLFRLTISLTFALPGSGWQAFSGILSVILGLLVMIQWPVSGMWVIGLFVGIDMIFSGVTWIALALALGA